ncbi:MAG: 50S ribosomal protein L3 [Spirochaetota bacterium]
MSNGLIGRKVGMSQVFDENGVLKPVTVLEVGPCFVSQLKTQEKDGYSAVQMSFGEVRKTQLSKAEVNHLEKNKIQPNRFLKEFAFDGDAPNPGDTIQAQDIFAVNDKVKVSSVSKGKGFQGVVKRYGHRGGPASHGSRHHRLPGSIGACATPSRVFKGTRLPGRTGGKKTTVINLNIVKIVEEKNLIMVSGSVPGSNQSIITVEKI